MFKYLSRNQIELQIQYNHNENPNRIFVLQFHKLIKRSIWKHKGGKMRQDSLKKQQKCRFCPPEVQNYYHTIVLKTGWYWCWYRQMDSLNRTESPHRDIWTPNLRWRCTAQLWGKDELLRQWCQANHISKYPKL